MNLTPNAKTVSIQWKQLYQISRVSALITAILIPISIVAFFIWPLYPEDIFTVIQNDRLAGIMGLDFLYLAGHLFAIPLFVVFYVTLRETNKSLSGLALVLGILGLTALISARPIVEMLALSDQYAVATTEAQKSEIMAAGRVVLAMFRGTAYNVHYVFGTSSLLISSIIMLQSRIYSKSIAYVGIVTNALVFTYYVPVIGVYLSLISVAGYFVWWLQIAQKLKQLEQGSKFEGFFGKEK